MTHSRRQFLAAAAATFGLAGCVGPHVAPHGHSSSYTSQFLKPQNRNTVFHWVDAALQQVRDQRVLTPRGRVQLWLGHGRRISCRERDRPGL